MPFVINDRVQETTATTGTGTLTLAGAVTGFQSFSAIGNANTTYYTIYDPATGAWEVGIGTYTASGTTLSRTTVLSSSNAGSLVSFASGTKYVWCDYPASRAVIEDDNGLVGIGTVNDGTAILQIAGGTTTAAALEFNNGTLMTSPDGGSMEYDGRIGYFTPNNLERGVMPAEQFYRLNSTVAGANVNTAQSVFGVGVTLSASTVYVFEGMYYLIKTAGVTSHTMGISFGGGATLNNSIIQAVAYGNSTTAYTNGNISAATNTTITGAIAIASAAVIVRLCGTVSINAGGTFIPQYTLSAAPGGAYTTQIGSYFRISPIGASGANTSVGRWA